MNKVYASRLDMVMRGLISRTDALQYMCGYAQAMVDSGSLSLSEQTEILNNFTKEVLEI